MNPFFQLYCHRSISHKVSYCFHFTLGAGLESPWIVKYEALVALKDQFILDVVASPLRMINTVNITGWHFWLTSMDPWTTMGPIWSLRSMSNSISSLIIIWDNTFSSLALKTSGSSVVLQTLWRIVVFPAFDLPMMRTRKQPMRSKCSLTLAGSIRKSAASEGNRRGSIQFAP